MAEDLDRLLSQAEDALRDFAARPELPKRDALYLQRLVGTIREARIVSRSAFEEPPPVTAGTRCPRGDPQCPY